ncbi:hypothetical protein NADFUDRAFT_68350 [Nadsonia fulvescens var. elongata DSM 6958]|uniref:Uncharacterized protein n=1 Tax=Nadsonia fulvescens var. elongata DSM 6958 TaxID=857566 RepID=A0A1E3PRS0_9ASCO|nr:hypothetical protein NADFUDRAFT_68350 [Nadsonia fulvescens var. elongata DSM 6958]
MASIQQISQTAIARFHFPQIRMCLIFFIMDRERPSPQKISTQRNKGTANGRQRITIYVFIV